MTGPISQPFRRKRGAFSCAGKSVIRNADHTEISLFRGSDRDDAGRPTGYEYLLLS